MNGSDDDKAIFNSCNALLFFGVPNDGLNADNLLSLIRGQNNQDLVENLKEGSPLLQDLHNTFFQTFGGRSVNSFLSMSVVTARHYR
jgi:hypothetical protein